MKTGGRAGTVARCGPGLALIAALAAPVLAGDAPGDDRLTLPGLDHAPLTAAAVLEQGTTLLVVWATWSPRCRDVAARIDRLAETWSDRARVASVVFQGSGAAVRAAVAERGLGAPVYLDPSGDFSKRHAVTTLPMLLIFRDGQLAFRGKLSANPDAVIERALGAG